LSDADELLDGSGGILSDADEPPEGTGGGILSDADELPDGTGGGILSDADEPDDFGSGGIVVPRDGGAVIDRTGGAGGTFVCVPDAERVRGSGATSPCATCSGAVMRAGATAAFGALNMRSSPGSLASGFWLETISMSSLTAVDSVFPMFKLQATSPGRIANALRSRKRNPATLPTSYSNGWRDLRNEQARARSVYGTAQHRRRAITVVIADVMQGLMHAYLDRASSEFRSGRNHLKIH
jgi:hypothetical protein